MQRAEHRLVEDILLLRRSLGWKNGWDGNVYICGLGGGSHLAVIQIQQPFYQYIPMFLCA